MRAAALTEFGGADKVSLRDVADPPVGPDTVLVSVRAAGVNPVDWKVASGKLKPLFPHRFPLVPGWDVAGVVERVGPAVTEFAPGDEVIAYARRDDVQWGTYAELVPVPVRCVAAAPVSVDLTHAAALPLAGLTALQAVEAVGVGPDDTVLVHAAAGGVGQFAAQLARLRGARVIGTAGPDNHAYLRETLHVEAVEYGEGLAERVRALAPDGVDAALDFVGGDALDVSPALVHDPGRIVTVVDAAAVAELGGRYVFVRPDAAGLAHLVELVDAGELHVDLARTFPLAEVARAWELSQTGHVRGKVVIEV
ncbi:NADP-dependent oxidoreductase [Kineococcus gynurae]|uniref:NADP-dependent oxidoreductase n=1 Tax=Kineococcus gynurae TaxID=452979 RepID=A0ABV5LX63_9ACTN